MYTPNKGLVATYLACAIITVGSIAFIHASGISLPITTYSSYKSAPEIIVTGEGKVQMAPDTATITLGITVNKSKTAEEAQRAIDSVHNDLVEAIKTLGIPDADISTSTYSIQPNYSYSGSTQRIDGYNGTAQVTIKTQKLELVDAVLAQATARGANQVSDVSYSIDNPSSAKDKAREAAIKDAKNKAAKIAKELDSKLGKAISINENGAAQEYPQPMIKSMELQSDASGPEIQPGSDDVVVYVTVVFEKL